MSQWSRTGCNGVAQKHRKRERESSIQYYGIWRIKRTAYGDASLGHSYFNHHNNALERIPWGSGNIRRSLIGGCPRSYAVHRVHQFELIALPGRRCWDSFTGGYKRGYQREGDFPVSVRGLASRRSEVRTQ